MSSLSLDSSPPASEPHGGELPCFVTMSAIMAWSFEELDHSKEREAKLEWAAARPLSPEAKACDLVGPFAWLFEKLTTAHPEAARSVARAARVPRAAAAPRDRAAV